MVYGVCGKVAQECYALKSLRKRKGIFGLIDIKKTGGKISRKPAGYQGRNSIDLEPDLPAFTTTISFQVHQGYPSASLSSPVQ